MADIQELLRQREEVERQIQQLQQSGRQESIATVRQLMAEHNITVHDLVTPIGTGKGAGRRGPNKGATVRPKYRDPASGKTWSGRGLKPRWFNDALSNGKTVQDLAIPDAG